MVLGAENVIDLQFFLMDTAKRYLDALDAFAEADDLFANAAALDYALLLSSERGDEAIDDAAPVAATVRDTMTRAAGVALDFAERLLAAPPEIFADFVRRHGRDGGFFDVLAQLRERGVVTSTDVAFRALTLASDVAERRRRSGA